MKIRTQIPGTKDERAIRLDQISEALYAEGYQYEVDFEGIYGEGWQVVAIQTTDNLDCQRAVERLVARFEAEERLAARSKEEDTGRL